METKNLGVYSAANSYKAKYVSAVVYKNSYSQQQQADGIKKMGKANHKSAEYVIESKNMGKVCLYFGMALKKILNSSYKHVITQISKYEGT